MSKDNQHETVNTEVYYVIKLYKDVYVAGALSSTSVMITRDFRVAHKYYSEEDAFKALNSSDYKGDVMKLTITDVKTETLTYVDVDAPEDDE